MGKQLPEASGTTSKLGTKQYDGVFEALASPRRRAALAYLRETEGSVALTELATEIAHRERETGEPALRHEQWNDVTAALAHVHLPKLADEGLVEYDEAAETVVLGDLAEPALTQLDAMDPEK